MKIIFPISKKFYFDISKKIFKKKNSVIYFIHENQQNNKKNIINTKKFYDFSEFKNIEFSKKKANKIINNKFYHKYEKFFTEVFNRTSYRNRTLKFKKQFFLKQVIFFIDFLKNKKIKKIFFTSTPHMGWSIPFYYACKIQKVETIISHLTDIPNVCILRSGWEDKQFLEIKNKRVKFDDLIKKNLINPSLWTNKIRDRFTKSNVFIDHLRFWKFFFHILFIKKNEDIVDSCFFYDTKITKINKLIYYLKFYIHTVALNLSYYFFSRKVNHKEKYIYFAIHYQPERTTIPESFFYGDQLKAIKKLRALIPKNIKIIIKEHPVQLLLWHPRPSQIKYRSLNFYREINSIQNTKIANIKEDSNKLIKNSLAVSTMTGSTGWEALKKNKPAIVFGYPWYAKHPRCYIYKHINKKKINLIIKYKNQKSTNKESYIFLKKMEKYFFISWIADHVTDKLEYKNLVEQASLVFKKILKL